MSNVVKITSNKGIGVSVQNQLLNTKNLTSGAGYQRPVDSKRVERIISQFNEHKVNPIKVSFRDGRYWVYDGQHTLTVLKAMNKGEDCMVWCEVHFGLTYEDEAKLFAEQYDGSTKVDINYKMNALYEAGDPVVVDMKVKAESAGLTMNFTKGKGDNKLIAVGKLHNIYKSMGAESYRKILCLIKQAWAGQSTSLDKEILGGVAMFVDVYGEIFSEDVFVKNLRKVLPLEIKRKGDSDISAKGDLKYAKQILEAYNHGLTKKNRLDYIFKG